jgi:hypothetical protein
MCSNLGISSDQLSGKSDPVSDIYGLHNMRKVQPCTLSPSKLLGVLGLIHEVYATLVVVGGGVIPMRGEGCDVFCLDGVRGTPLDLSFFRFPSLSLSLSIHYSLIPSISTGSLSGDCDRYGHSHVM